MIDKHTLGEIFEANRSEYIGTWKQLLTFPSVSADPDHDGDCRACAQWLEEHLRGIGFDAQLLETAGKPVVYAARAGASGQPTILFYGHYDVQPADPPDAWASPPFEPALRNGRLYARGAQDNKGQLLYALKAMEALLARGALTPSVKILIEGEEESGSAGTSAALPTWAERIKADVLLVTDTDTSPDGAPAIIMGLRGIVHASFMLTGPRDDLHSGMHGGLAPNPATETARLIAGLHNPDGSIAVEGFYASVTKPSRDEREAANATPFDGEDYRRATGVPPCGGERRFTPAERLGFRPALDVNDLHGGYAGAGIKTIIPAAAGAKLTARLAAGQDPEWCLEAIVRHLRQHAPEGLTLEITEKGVGGEGFRLNPHSPIVEQARRVLRQIGDREPVLLWEGASIPVVSALSRVSGAEPLLVGFGRQEDNIHAPNESFSLEQFRMGFLYAGLILQSLA